MKYHWLWLWVICLSGLSEAQSRCDCRELQGSCQAAVHYRDGLLEVTTDTEQCAQVLYYLDGQPQVRLVTDGRDVQQQTLAATQQLQVGPCQRCKEEAVSVHQQQQVNQRCEAQFLMPTAATESCLHPCTQIDNAKQKSLCERNCQQHSRCLDKACVQSLTQQLTSCEQRCDREMQSSMAADIDAYRDCQQSCERFKQEIRSCPIL